MNINNDRQQQRPPRPQSTLNLAALAISDGQALMQGVAALRGQHIHRAVTPRPARNTQLPPLRGFDGPFPTPAARSLRVEGTNVLRVPFGVRQRGVPGPNDRIAWVTLVLPFQAFTNANTASGGLD